MKRYLPTLLLLIILSTFVSFSLMFFLHNGLGKSLSLIGYVFLAASILAFLFFLSIDPGYGWVNSANLHKNHIVVSIFIALFIVSVGLIVVGRQMTGHQTHTLIDDVGVERVGGNIPAQ